MYYFFNFHSNRKKAVRAAAIKKWPGNSLPNFKKSPESLKELVSLVEDLAEDCSYAPVGFHKDKIRQHILDVLNERRRSIRNGHDYTKVDKTNLARHSLVWAISPTITFHLLHA